MFTPHAHTSTRDQVLFSLYLVKLHKRMYNNMLKLGQLNFLVSLDPSYSSLVVEERVHVSISQRKGKHRRELTLGTR